MASSKPLIFQSVDVGGTTYELIDADNVEISNEIEELMVDNQQSIISGITGSISVPVFDLSVQNDSAVITDSNVDPATDKTNLTLNGATGSSTVSLSNVYVTAVLKFDRPNPYVLLKATLKASSSQLSIT